MMLKNIKILAQDVLSYKMREDKILDELAAKSQKLRFYNE